MSTAKDYYNEKVKIVTNGIESYVKRWKNEYNLSIKRNDDTLYNHVKNELTKNPGSIYLRFSLLEDEEFTWILSDVDHENFYITMIEDINGEENIWKLDLYELIDFLRKKNILDIKHPMSQWEIASKFTLEIEKEVDLKTIAMTNPGLKLKYKAETRRENKIATKEKEYPMPEFSPYIYKENSETVCL